MRIYLIRHGQSTGNVDRNVHRTIANHAVPLSEQGHQEALDAGKFLARHFQTAFPSYVATGTFPVRAWTSPYRRTRETAKGLIESISAHSSGTVLGGGLHERINLAEQEIGLFDGIPLDDIPISYPRESEHYARCREYEGWFWARPPLGESIFDVALRVQSFQRELKEDWKERRSPDTYLIVTHGTTMRAFIQEWMRYPVEWMENEPRPGNCAIRLLTNEEENYRISPDFKDLGYIYGRSLPTINPYKKTHEDP